METEKKSQKERFVQSLIDLYVEEQDEKRWNLNDAFHVSIWFMSGMIARIVEADHHRTSYKELHKRTKKLVLEEIDDLFKQIEQQKL